MLFICLSEYMLWDFTPHLKLLIRLQGMLKVHKLCNKLFFYYFFIIFYFLLFFYDFFLIFLIFLFFCFSKFYFQNRFVITTLAFLYKAFAVVHHRYKYVKHKIANKNSKKKKPKKTPSEVPMKKKKKKNTTTEEN